MWVKFPLFSTPACALRSSSFILSAVRLNILDGTPTLRAPSLVAFYDDDDLAFWCPPNL